MPTVGLRLAPAMGGASMKQSRSIGCRVLLHYAETNIVSTAPMLSSVSVTLATLGSDSKDHFWVERKLEGGERDGVRTQECQAAEWPRYNEAQKARRGK